MEIAGGSPEGNRGKIFSQKMRKASIFKSSQEGANRGGEVKVMVEKNKERVRP